VTQDAYTLPSGEAGKDFFAKSKAWLDKTIAARTAATKWLQMAIAAEAADLDLSALRERGLEAARICGGDTTTV
jgi:hypothetical protein